MRLNIDMLLNRLEKILIIENRNKIHKIKYDKESLKEIASLSGGDMRYGINLLQLISDRFGNITLKNISVLCDYPSYEIIANIFNLIKNKNIKDALIESYKLKEIGYSVNDIFTTMFQFLKSSNELIDEEYKMNILYIL